MNLNVTFRLCSNLDGSVYAKGLCYGCYRKQWLASGGAKVNRHGTAYAYDKARCRCPLCTQNHAARIADYRRRKRAGLV